MTINVRTALSVLALLAAWNGVGATAEEPARMTWDVEGVKREALVYLPATAKTRPNPVVFVFHGHGGNMQGMANRQALHRLWPEAICVYPQGLPSSGKITDPEGKKPGWQFSVGEYDDRDLKFFDAMLADLRKQYRVDDTRIYATGMSNGGAFTYLLWSARGEAFAAVAPIAAAAPIGETPADLPPRLARFAENARKRMKDVRPKPVLHVAGEKDPVVPFAWQRRTIDALRRVNGCEEGKPWGERCTIYPSKSGTPVVTYIHGGSHTIPPDAPAIIVSFFREYPKPAAGPINKAPARESEPVR